MKHIELEDLIKKEAQERFPATDPNWFVKRWMDKDYEFQRNTAKAVIPMMAEVVRAFSKGAE
jgi:hypothetical protein